MTLEHVIRRSLLGSFSVRITPFNFDQFAGKKDAMRIREAELPDAAAMARVSVDSYRAAHRDQIPEESLLQFTYEESERNWARTIQELSESDERQEFIYVAETASGTLMGVAMGGPERS